MPNYTIREQKRTIAKLFNYSLLRPTVSIGCKVKIHHLMESANVLAFVHLLLIQCTF